MRNEFYEMWAQVYAFVFAWLFGIAMLAWRRHLRVNGKEAQNRTVFLSWLSLFLIISTAPGALNWILRLSQLRFDVVDGITQVVLDIAGFSQSLLPLFVVFWLVFRLRPLQKGEIRKEADSTNIKHIVKSVFDSEEFLSALRETLPKGAKDVEHGLDYIPYQLRTLEENRRRFERRAHQFFFVMLALGLIFGGIIAYLGYILVNDTSIGLPRDVSELRSATVDLNLAINKWGTLSSDDETLRKVRSDLSAFATAHSDESEKLVGVQRDLSDYRYVHLQPLMVFLEEQKKGVTNDELLSGLYSHEIEIVQKAQNTFIGAIDEITRMSKELPTLVTRVEGEIDKDKYRVAELFKRLSIGIVVASFFFAILRYVAQQYRAHWDESIRADHEIMWTRRMVVGMKSAIENSSDDRSSVIENILQGMPGSGATGSKTGESDPKMDFDLIKELLNAISKKM